ncbi:hypothetical protein [Wolbachia endosymbiont of Dactylopius coccus]
MTLSFGNGVFFNAPKSILQSFIFEDATKFDSLSDMNKLTLISKQSEVKCMNEVANDVNFIATDLSSVLIQPIPHEAKSPYVHAPA